MTSSRATERREYEYRRKGNVGLSRRGKKSEWQDQKVHFPERSELSGPELLHSSGSIQL